MEVSIKSCAIDSNLPDFNKVSQKMATLITMTVQLIIKHLIVQKCERMSYHTHTACIMYKKGKKYFECSKCFSPKA